MLCVFSDDFDHETDADDNDVRDRPAYRVCRYQAEDGLLNKPQITVWSQWMATVTIGLVGLELVSATLARNF